MKATNTQSNKQKKFHKHRHIHLRLPCPACHFDRLIDTGQNTKSQTYAPSDPGYDDANYYQKCFGCKSEIGIRKIE